MNGLYPIGHGWYLEYIDDKYIRHIYHGIHSKNSPASSSTDLVREHPDG